METQSWSVSPPSRTDTKFRAGGRTGSMWWNGSPIQTYQYIWYIPKIGKDAAIPYTEITCCPSTITWNRKNVGMLWGEVVVMNSLQCHMQRIDYWSTSQPKVNQEGMPPSPSKQHEPVDPGLTGLTSPDPVDEGLHADDDMSVPLRQSSRAMRN